MDSNDRKNSDPVTGEEIKGTFEKAGEKIDSFVDEAGKQVDGMIEEAGIKINEAEEKIDAAGEKIDDKVKGSIDAAGEEAGKVIDKIEEDTVEESVEGEGRKPGVFVSLIPVIVMMGLLLLSLLKFEWDVQIPLITAAVVAACIAVWGYKIPYKTIEQGIFNSIMNAMQAILIACLIGLIISAWIAGGIVPSLIYYGLKILSPRFFLVTCLLVCSIAGIATGSSWTVAGTIGVAMIGIGVGMGIPAPVTAGAVISGGYFGDKMSPFSDTTNLAPASAGTTLFAHIRHMVYTTGVSYIIAIVLFWIVNTRFVSNMTADEGSITEIMAALKDGFTINPWLMLPVAIIFILIAFKIPAIPGLVLSVVMGIICALCFQGVGLASMGDILEWGFTSETGNAVIDDLLTRGGLQNMMWTVSLIMCALTFGGVMFASGMLEAIAVAMLRLAKGTGGLIAVTELTAFVVILICGEQYLGIILTGKMYKDEYRKRGLAPQNLSRALEDSGTLLSPLIPWSTCGVAMSSYLGVATLAYIPYCFLNLVNPLVGLFYGFTGKTIRKIDEVDPNDIVD